MRFPSTCIRGVKVTLARRLSYVQGQSPSPRKREYFYFIDHQGQLFLDDAKVKNFITCFKDKKFLAFFFRRIKPNTSGRYESEFPFISPCGPETNYIRCDDLPIVFTHLLDQHGQVIEDIITYGQTETAGSVSQNGNLHMLEKGVILKEAISQELRVQHDGESSSSNFTTRKSSKLENEFESLSYGGTGNILTFPFQPEKLCMLPESGRVYHTGAPHLGGIGLVKSSLAIELSHFFMYKDGAKENHAPVQFRWRGRIFQLDNSILNLTRSIVHTGI